MDYWHVSRREALETLLEIQPTGTIALSDPMRDHVKRSAMILPKDDRRRFAISPKYPSFVPYRFGASAGRVGQIRRRRRIRHLEARGLRRSDCVDCGRARRIPSRSLGSLRGGARIRACGKRLISVALPDYPIHAIETKTLPADGGESASWETIIPLGESLAEYEAALSAPPGEYAASGGGFDMYADGDALIYIKEGCADDDARGRFFLSVFPVDPSDLPKSAREAGREHESLNFDFYQYGAILDGGCVIIRYLPDYTIGNLETGQWMPGEGELWRAEMAVGD